MSVVFSPQIQFFEFRMAICNFCFFALPVWKLPPTRPAVTHPSSKFVDLITGLMIHLCIRAPMITGKGTYNIMTVRNCCILPRSCDSCPLA